MEKRRDSVRVSSVKEMMEQMGFKKDAPVSTQEAFLKHLMKSVNKGANLIPFSKPVKEANNLAQVQLELFDKAS